MRLPAFQVMPGDLVDLQNDKVADPNGAIGYFASQYVRVLDVERETTVPKNGATLTTHLTARYPVVIYLDGYANPIAFPSNHLIKVVG